MTEKVQLKSFSAASVSQSAVRRSVLLNPSIMSRQSRINLIVVFGVIAAGGSQTGAIARHGAVVICKPICSFISPGHTHAVTGPVCSQTHTLTYTSRSKHTKALPEDNLF